MIQELLKSDVHAGSSSRFAWLSGAWRRLVWRVGRRLYCYARGEIANEMGTNGEAYVQACVIKGTHNAGGTTVIFDVGANVGDWTQLFITQLSEDRVPTTQVHLFEPVQSTYATLEKKLASAPKNECARSYLLAMSDSAGTAELAVLSNTGGTNSLEFDRTIATTVAEVLTINTETVTGFCEAHGISHVHLLKCDAEGHDLRVLMGAREMLKNGQINVVQFEYNYRWVYARAFLKDAFDLIAGLPYHVARLCPDHIEILQVWHPELDRFFEANYLLVHNSALTWFDMRVVHFDTSNTYA